jgi:ABC-type multidrug transport system fused ATPase/permease subunit
MSKQETGKIDVSLQKFGTIWLTSIPSLERIQGYIDIEQEAPATESGKPPASWPTSGALSVQKLSARYTPDGPSVLHGLTFDIKSGEKVGVGALCPAAIDTFATLTSTRLLVGRTGSGKSSLTLSCLRLIPTDGDILYDGIPISSINLEALRSNITIIPQQPELLASSSAVFRQLVALLMDR